MLKADLRTTYLDTQMNLSATERFEKSQHISQCFFQNFALEDVQFLHIFLAIEKNKEIETRFIYEKIWRDFPQIKIIVPRVNFGLGNIESLEFNRETQLSLNKWQILEPQSNKLVEAKKIDAVLIPLLCFDYKGFRVGYGKGFYDRFLKNCRADCLKIGLSYFSPVERIIDTIEGDVTLDYCVTPEKVWKF